MSPVCTHVYCCVIWKRKTVDAQLQDSCWGANCRTQGNCHDSSGYDSLHGWKLTFIQFGDCLPFPTLHCSLRLWQNTRIVLATLHPTMLPVRGKCGNNVACYADTRNISGDFQKHLLCLPQMLRQNKSTFGKHDHVSNVATTMCPHFAGPFPSLSVSFT